VYVHVAPCAIVCPTVYSSASTTHQPTTTYLGTNVSDILTAAQPQCLELLQSAQIWQSEMNKKIYIVVAMNNNDKNKNSK
jgi:hypothetical protein